MDLGSNPSECQILNLFRSVPSSLLHLRSVGRSNFDKGLHNLIKLIKKRNKIITKMKLLCYKMESTVDSYKKETLLTGQHVDKSPNEEKKVAE